MNDVDAIADVVHVSVAAHLHSDSLVRVRDGRNFDCHSYCHHVSWIVIDQWLYGQKISGGNVLVVAIPFVLVHAQIFVSVQKTEPVAAEAGQTMVKIQEEV